MSNTRPPWFTFAIRLALARGISPEVIDRAWARWGSHKGASSWSACTWMNKFATAAADSGVFPVERAS